VRLQHNLQLELGEVVAFLILLCRNEPWSRDWHAFRVENDKPFETKSRGDSYEEPANMPPKGDR